VFFALLILPTVLAAWLDDRTVRDINPWIKPLKFQVSVAVYLGTLAWFAGWLPAHTRSARWWTPFLAITLFSACYEIFWIMGASMFGVESHFNVSTPLMGMAYTLAGFFAVLLTTASLVMGYQFLKHPPPGLAPAVQLGLALGLLLTFVGTVIVAGYLGGAPGHYVGEAVSEAISDTDGLPVLGWSTQVGDLRVAHFFATHALQIIPLLSLPVAWLLPESVQRLVMWIISALYAGLIVGTFAQALMGLPFNRLPF
jgi:hypothetical protein